MRTIGYVLIIGALLVSLWIVNHHDDDGPGPTAVTTIQPVDPRDDIDRTPPTTTTTTPAARPLQVVARARTAPTSRPDSLRSERTAIPTRGERGAGVRSISSTMYCQRGHMANGQPVHDGAVSSKVLPRGSRWRVLTGPMTGRTFTVQDTGSLAYFDMWTGSCPEAIRYGRRPIQIAAA